MANNFELGVFPDGIAGHPACVAFLIMSLYPDFETAVERPAGATYCRALCDQRIPGGGSDVWAAIDCLKRGQVLGADEALNAAAHYWERREDLSASARTRGNAQAANISERFRATLSDWGRTSLPN